MRTQVSSQFRARKHTAWPFLRLSPVCLLTLLAACASTQQKPYEDRGLVLAEKSLGDPAPDANAALGDTCAIIDGAGVTWEQLRPFMAEAGGRLALEEIALDQLVNREARRRDLSVTKADIDFERELLNRSLLQTARASNEQDAARIIQAVRLRRGLGPERFKGLLRRSALLRKMVQDDVLVAESSVDQMYELIHGVRYQARIITVDTVADAALVQRQLEAGERFGDLAATLSTDPSAARGGIIEPISPVDTAYPSSIRRALEMLRPGEVSTPIALSEGFAVLKLEKIIEPDGVPLDSVRAELELAARRQQERLYMNRLADRLIETARITVLDASLEFAWRSRAQ